MPLISVQRLLVTFVLWMARMPYLTEPLATSVLSLKREIWTQDSHLSGRPTEHDDERLDHLSNKEVLPHPQCSLFRFGSSTHFHLFWYLPNAMCGILLWDMHNCEFGWMKFWGKITYFYWRGIKNLVECGEICKLQCM